MATITRRLDSVLNDMEDILLYSKEDFNNAISEASNADKDTLSDKTANLYNMFIKAGINECEKNQSVKYYKKLFEDRIETNDDYNRNVEERVLSVLFDKFEMFPSPEDYMKRIVNNNSFKEDKKWKTDSLRLRILKQFIKYTDYLRMVDYGGAREYNACKIGIQRHIAEKLGVERYRDVEVDDVIENIDDTIFEFIDTDKWTGRDKLLKTADNLAKGKFRTSGRTTMEIYYFAMAYDMTYYSGAKGTVYQAKTDIEKNLFRDFYYNNLVRVASDEYKNTPGAYEAIPTGRGINYKNYAEMVYIYYISKDITPLDKVEKSAEMIRRLQESAENRNEEEELINVKPNTTEYFRKHFKIDDDSREEFCEDIINSTEDEFYRFIDSNYDCRKINANPVSKEKEQNTAYVVYGDIINRIKKYNDGIVEKDAVSFVDSELDLGRLWIVDFKLFDEALENIKKDINSIDQEKYDKFVLIVGKAIDLINDKEYLKKSVSEMSRTAVVIAYYYYFCLEYINEISEGNVTFRDIYNLVSLDLNQALERCGYQTLNGRDIFDVIVLMSIYVYAKI